MIHFRAFRPRRPLTALTLVALVLISAAAIRAEGTAPVEGPLTPDEALKSFRLEPGLRIELVAAEPTVVSPSAMTFDENGRMYVAENQGYPTGPKPGEPPLGRIALLEDLDRDGRYEKRTEFATGLTYPNGVMCWKGGLIVTCAPDILYLKDTDGDGRADSREVWFTGFSTTGSTQLRVSHPTLAVDGWIYVTSGLTGGEITCPKHPDRPAVKIGRTDFRFRPDLSEYEPCDGGAQFGLSFDDYVRRFICYNRVQVQHVVLSSRQLRRNPNLPFSDTVQNCPVDLQAEPLRGHGAAARLFPISRNVTTADSHAGTFTAACGVTIWRGDSLPQSYLGGAFSCDPTGNLVHFDKLQPSGATFTAQRVRDGIEFLASPDGWFRPVFLSHGPDGGLYVVDMYRKTIEHPDYLPVEVRKHTDFESGKTMGRIWRVTASKHDAAELATRRGKRFDDRSPESLAQALDHPNGWRRDAGFRLFLENPRAEAIPALQSVARKGVETAARIAAVRLLDLQDALDSELRSSALREMSRAALREQIVLITARRLGDSSEAFELLRPLSNDPHARVRFQAALALGDFTDARGIDELAAIAIRDSSDRWARAAVLSGIAGRETLFLDALLVRLKRGESPSPELLFDVGRILGASRPESEWPVLMRKILVESTLSGEAPTLLVTGMGEAFRARGAGRGGDSVLLSAAGSFADVAAALKSRFAASLETVGLANAAVERRKAAIEFLAHSNFETAGERLLGLVDPREPAVVQAAALRALSRMKQDRIAAELLSADRFPAYTPGLRDEVLAAIFAGPQHLPGLLSALETGIVPKGAVDALRRRQLVEHRDPEIRARAAKLFQLDESSDRAKVYAEFKSVVGLPAQPANGKVVFKRVCANCHRLDQDGYAVGPDLFGIRNQPKEAILLHILVPNHEITPGFTAYVATLKDGRVLTGLVSSETATSVTLKQPLGKEESVLRSDLEELVASKLSLMPQNVESQVTRQEFADLLAHLKGER